MLARLRPDIQCILDRDPAARSRWEVLTCYPRLHALYLHRRAHWRWGHGLKWLGRFISHVARFLPAMEFHRAAPSASASSLITGWALSLVKWRKSVMAAPFTRV